MDAILSRSAIEAEIADHPATSLRHAELTLRTRLGLCAYSDDAIRQLWEILEGNQRFSERLAAENRARARAQSEIRGAMQNIDPEFIVICQSAWMNVGGFGINFNWDGERFNNRTDAIKHGWHICDSDDFNIGQVYGDDLIWFGWMDQRMNETPDDMAEIAAAIGLTFDPRWYELTYSKADGRAIGPGAAK